MPLGYGREWFIVIFMFWNFLWHCQWEVTPLIVVRTYALPTFPLVHKITIENMRYYSSDIYVAA